MCNKCSNITYNEMHFCQNCYNISAKLENKYDQSLSENVKHEVPTQILNNIYIGSKLTMLSKDKLLEMGINKIIIAGKKINRLTQQDNSFEYTELLIDDSLEQDLLSYISISNKFIDDNFKSKILIHCNSGISRSASILIAYLMHHFNWEYERAFEFVKLKYPKAHPNINFENQLKSL